MSRRLNSGVSAKRHALCVNLRSIRPYQVLIGLLTILLIASQSLAGTTGKIAGRVTDAETGEGLPGANVVIEGTSLGSATDNKGNFVILNVPPGTYSVMFRFIGYQTVRVNNVRVNVDFTTTLNQELGTTALEVGEVTVVAERNPLVREDLTNTTVAISSETIKELPVDSFSDVVRLQSGVTVDNSGAIHIRGGRANEVAYMINGVRVTNPFSNNLGVGLATNAIQELTVSSGTFSAEYGDALSGVINFVTKDGGPSYAGSFQVWTGDNLSTRDELFENIDEIDALNANRIEATLSGPVPLLGKKWTFFGSGVRVDDDGYLIARRLYAPSDLLDISSSEWVFDTLGDSLPSGDGEIVPLNPIKSWNATAKLSFKASPTFKLSYDLVYDRSRRNNFGTGYRRSFKFNPDGMARFRSDNWSHSLGITHTLGERMFYNLKFAFNVNDQFTGAFEDPFDPRYQPDDLLLFIPNTPWYAGGTDLNRDRLNARTMSAKLDVVTQIGRSHEFKFGAEVRQHRLEREFYTLVYDTTDARQGRPPTIPYPWVDENFDTWSFYVRKPTQVAAYLLDKIELAKTFIVNAGLRYEYLDTKALFQPDLINSIQSPSEGLEDAEPKHRVSPRVSVSYPITDRGIIRFSYGHFYQLPDLIDIYVNPFFFPFERFSNPNFGNSNLNPQRSIQYEMGLQQQLTDDFKIDVTLYSKDVTDLLQNRRIRAGMADRVFDVISNVSYSNVRGISVGVVRRRSPQGLFSATLDYTFQIAEGSRTDEDDFFFDQNSGKETERTFVPLSFDRQHVLNGTFSVGKPNSWNTSLIASFWSGTPYTPSLPSDFAPVEFEENSDRRPVQLDVDFRAEKFFQVGNIDLSVFLFVDNLLDIKNEQFIHLSSGRALFALEETTNANVINRLRTRFQANPGLFPPESELDNFYRRQDWLSEPRQVRLGFSFGF